jgi:hypothetical protein
LHNWHILRATRAFGPVTILNMAVAQIGPLTSAFEALAAVVGAGIVLGGFASGVYRLAATRPRDELETRVLPDGYAGGVVAILVVLIDLAVRYGA